MKTIDLHIFQKDSQWTASADIEVNSEIASYVICADSLEEIRELYREGLKVVPGLSGVQIREIFDEMKPLP